MVPQPPVLPLGIHRPDPRAGPSLPAARLLLLVVDLLFGGFVVAAAYTLVEVLPDAGLIRLAFQSRARKSRIALVEAQILENPPSPISKSWASSTVAPRARRAFRSG